MAIQSVTGSFTATGQSGTITPAVNSSGSDAALFNMSLWGTFVGTVKLERSFDGSTWLPLTALGSAIQFSAPCTEVFQEGEEGVQYRLNCSAFTSGTISYRLSL